MAVRDPVVIDGLYYGDLSYEEASFILHIREQEVIKGLKNMIFDFPEDMVKKSIDEGKSIRNMIKEKGLDYSDYVGTLSDKQTVGTAFLYASPRSMLGDHVGAGKTPMVAGLLNLLKEKGQMKRFVMAVDGTAIIQTHREMVRFTGLNVVELPSEAAKMRRVIKRTNWAEVDGIMIKHSALRSDVLSKWLAIYLDADNKSKIFDTFILDESSVIKNSTTKIFDYTYNICRIVDRVHAMNATPFETHIIDIYNQMDMINDTLLPKRWKIEKKYCVYGWGEYWKSERGEDGKFKPVRKKKREFVSYRNEGGFRESLKLVYLGRKSEPKEHSYKVHELTPTENQMMALARGYRHMEVLNSPEDIPEIGLSLTRETSPKLDKLIGLLEDELLEDNVMIYCFHIKAQQRIYEEAKKIGRRPVTLNGSDGDESRIDKMGAFNRGDNDILITNIKKSLNLTGGDACVLYTMESNPSKLEQISGRIDRNVDDKKKKYIILVYKGTPEYRLLTDVCRQRSIDARNLILNAKTAIDYFMEDMESEKSEEE